MQFMIELAIKIRPWSSLYICPFTGTGFAVLYVHAATRLLFSDNMVQRHGPDMIVILHSPT